MESPPTVYITSETYAHALCRHYAAHMRIWKHSLSLCFHLYVYIYVRISVSHQNRLEDMKCFLSYVCISIIRFDHYKERIRRMRYTSPGLIYGKAQLMMFICNKMHYAFAQRTMDKWKYSLTCTQPRTLPIESTYIGYQPVDIGVGGGMFLFDQAHCNIMNSIIKLFSH